MRKGLRMMGTMAMALVAPSWAWSQSPSFIPPPPGTPVAPVEIPAHVAQAPAERGDKPAGRRIINTTNAQIDYRIDTFGPSGIGKVEIYMTADRGVTWIKLGEDADKQSPAHVNLPGEGVYGIRLAITNGNGFGGRAPVSGDQPQLFVEVDASSPAAELLPYDIVPTQGAIDIRWTARDANMAAEPVSLYFRTRPDSTWQPIAQKVKNEGVHRWAFPHEVAGHFYLKLEVIDLAGNTTKVETPTPITLDQTEPEATLVSVTPRPRGPATTAMRLATPSALQPVASPPAALPPTSIPPTIPASLPSLPSLPTISTPGQE